MQQDFENYDLITPTAKISAPTHGGRAKCLQRLVRLDLPVPKTVALSFDAIKGIVSGEMPDLIDPSEIMFTPFEPKTKNRFIMYIEGVPAYLIKTAGRPTVTFEEIELDHINVKSYIKCIKKIT